MPIISFVASHAGLVLASVPVLVILGATVSQFENKTTRLVGIVAFSAGALALVLFIVSVPYVPAGGG